MKERERRGSLLRGPGSYDWEPLVGTRQANLHPGIIEFSLSISYGQFVPAAWRAVGRQMLQAQMERVLQ